MTDLAHTPRRTEPLRAQRDNGASEPAPDIEQVVPATNGHAPSDPPAAPVVCPNCSEPTQLVAVHKVAEEFCLACDHPLFWIPAFARTHDDDGASDGGDASLRRRPGTAGRRRLVGRPCPDCAEPNDIKAVYCLRCGSPMDPPPPPVVVEEPEPVPVMVQPSGPALPYWLLAALAILGLVLLIAVITVIVS